MRTPDLEMVEELDHVAAETVERIGPGWRARAPRAKSVTVRFAPVIGLLV